MLVLAMAVVILEVFFDGFIIYRLMMVFNLQMLPLNTNIRLAYSNGKDDEQNFIQNLSLFLCTFLKEHGQLLEKRLNLREALMEVSLVFVIYFYKKMLLDMSLLGVCGFWRWGPVCTPAWLSLNSLCRMW
jgi:hypothetical protein